MILQDILGLIPDNQTVVITDWKNEEIARYDGKNSIPDHYNDLDIEKITAKKGTIFISINLIYIRR